MRVNFVLLLAVCCGSAALAQSPGPFTATGSMTTARFNSTATLLQNGKVLIAGGSALSPDGISVISTAELYDPSMGAFTRTGDMNVAREGHTATPLPNGLVLIAGGLSRPAGVNGNPSVRLEASTEIYDPSNGTFIPAGNMTVARAGASAILLNDGRVLIAGGYDFSHPPGETPIGSSELFDPVTGTFALSGQLVESGFVSLATLLADGKVLFGHNPGPSAAYELYDPATGTFSLTGAGAYPNRRSESLNLLTSGKVLETVMLSCDPGNEAELYDPSAGTFSPTGKMTALRDGSNGTLLPDGTVLISGGSGDGLAVDTGAIRAELYHPVTGAFSLGGSMTVDRIGPTSTLLPDGTVLIAGGLGWNPGFQCCLTLASAEIYHPAVLVPPPLLLSVSGGGQGAILHASTHQIVSPGNPAVAGEALEIYLVGLIDGSVIPPQVAIGGRMAEILFFGNTPGFAGLNQVNVRVPGVAVPGPFVSVRLTYLSRPSNEVTIGVR